MRPLALLLLPLCIWLVSCGGAAQLAQPDIRTVTYAGSDWQAADISVSVTPAANGWHVNVASTADKPASTLLLELRFDSSLAARDAVQNCGGSDLSLLAANKPGGVGLGIVMPAGQSIRPGRILSFDLAAAPRIPSVVVGGPKPTLVTDLDGATNAGAVDLTWSYKLAGDYDQNSEVNIGDISAMGPRLNHSTSDGADDEADKVVDGDANGEVNISDLSILGANFLTGISGYNVYGADSDDLSSATSTLLGNVPFADHTKPVARLQFAYHVTDAQAVNNGFFYVRAVLNDSTEGDPSNVANVGGSGSALFAVPPVGENTVDAALSQAPSLALLNGDAPDIEDGAPLIAYATAAGELHLAYYRDAAWHSDAVGVVGSQYALPQLYVNGNAWYVVAYDVTLQKIVRLEYDKTLTLQGSEDVAAGVTDVPLLIKVDFNAADNKTGVAYAYNVTAGGYGVQYADDALGSFTLYPVALSATDQVLGLTFKYDSTGKPYLFFTAGNIVTTGSFAINFTLEQSEFDGSSWGFPTAVTYPDSPLQVDLGFATDGTTPKLAFTAARSVAVGPISVPLAFDGVVGTDNAGTWSFTTYYTSDLSYTIGDGFTTITLNLALDLGAYWARQDELSYVLGNGDLKFLIADLSPQSGSLAGEAHYAVANGAAYDESTYFDGSPGLPQSWGEQGSVHGATYLEFTPLDSNDILSGNFDQNAAVMFWWK